MSSKTSCRLEFPEVIVVEASAGSGKTLALAKRYLQLLINPVLGLQQIPLRNILAITFTNKATVEMKDRILELLKRIALDAFLKKEEEKDILELLGVDKKFAKKKACLIMNELMMHYDFFQVQTIDSFINALLLGSALNIDRSPSFKIKRDYSQYLSYCLDKVIEEAACDKEVFAFFEEFLKHYLFVENRSSWFPKKDILKLMEFLFTLSDKYGGMFEVYRGKSQDVIEKKTFLFRAVQKIFSEFPDGMNATAKNAILKFIETNNETFKFKNFPDRFKISDLPMNRGKSAPPQLVKQWVKIHKEICHLIELDATVTYNPYIKLCQKMLGFFDRITKDEDLLFLEELNYKARLLFQEGLTVAELYYRLATRFVHYLIDEFQDTSILQWKNLEMMIKDALASGGSLFYVGDKKQAIYRFRGGEAQLFNKVKDQFVHYNTKHRVLKKNWRSQKAIVEFNNEVFSQENLRNALLRMDIFKEVGSDNEAIEQILKVFEDSRQEYKPDCIWGYVCVERIGGNNQQVRNELVKEKLISLITQLNKRFSYKDIAILCRDNDEVELVTTWLLEAQIPVESEKTLNILKNTLIKEILSLLRFLYSPLDDLSFASFILGEVFRKATGLALDDMTDFLFQLKKKTNKRTDSSIYRDFRQHYPRVWDCYLDKFFKSVGFISPYELLVSIYERFRVIENFIDSQAFFMKFLELVKVQENEYVGLGDFLYYLENAQREDLYVTVAETDSVSVLTIHKSKGLEFGVVITPFLRMDINPETGGKGTHSYVTFPQEGVLGLVRITKEHRKYSARLNEIYKDAYIKACIDELNGMYVALTRARYELHIFIPRRSGIGYNKANCVIPPDIQQRGQTRIYENIKVKAQQPILQISPPQYQDWVQFLKDEFGDAYALKNRAKIIKGNVMHFVLSYIENLYQRNSKVVIAGAIKKAKVQYPFIKDFTKIEEKVTDLLQKKEFAPFFCVSDGFILREKEVVTSLGDTKRIDRLIVKKSSAWVIDYKSSRDNEDEYRTQLKEYIQIIKDIYSQRETKGYLVYLDELGLEEVMT